jgi:hypothetical protein
MAERLSWAEIRTPTLSLEFLVSIVAGALLAMLPMVPWVYILLSVLLSAMVAHIGWRLASLVTALGWIRALSSIAVTTALVVLLAWGFSIRFAHADTAQPSSRIGVGFGQGAEGIHNGPTTNIFNNSSPPPAPAHGTPQKDNPEFSVACKNAREAQLEANASPAVRSLLAKQYLLGKFWDEYNARIAPRRIGFNDPEAFPYYNKRLTESNANWRVTADNKAQLFGPVCIKCSGSGAPYASDYGVVVNGGEGNTFDQTNIDNAKTAVELDNTRQNHFGTINVNKGKAQPTNPEPEPKECQR